MTTPRNPAVKIVVVGDVVGKTCLLISYTQNKYPLEFIPTVFENYVKNVTVDGQEFNLELWDTSGLEDFDNLRPLSYANANCVLICYSVGRKISYKNVVDKWIPEIRHHIPRTPIVLVATQIDLRADSNKKTITTKEGKQLQRQIKAQNYVECSAKDYINVTRVFEEAIRCSAQKTSPSNSKSCVLI